MIDMNTPITELNLTFDTCKILRNAGYLKTVQDLMDQEQNKGILRVRNIGRKHYEEIKQVLMENDIELPEKKSRK